MNRSVAFYTLGCKLNFSETSSIGNKLAEIGYSKKDFTEGADVYVINTCSVTDHADRKCKKVVNEALRYNPNAYVVVMGCYAQLKPEEIATIPGVDLVLGASEKFKLNEYLDSIQKNETTKIARSPIKEVRDFVPGFSAGDRTRTFLKVQDGCDYFCTFCTIPLARGSSRSFNVDETLKVASELATGDVKEIVLTGCNLGDFGIQHQQTFFDLIKELDKLQGIERFRISSIEPNLLEDGIIDFVAKSNKFVPHFHIPLQSGSNKILKAMRRKYERELYQEKVERIKTIMPHCAIGVDVIVGFPGETEEDFLETYTFLNELDITYLHVFPYSERPQTTAVKLPDSVPLKVRGERTEQLRNLSEKKRIQFYQSFLNQTFPVLFEKEEKGGKMFGFTPNYLKIETEYDPLRVNEIANVTLNKLSSDTKTILGEILYYEPIHSK
jgi:threonylcarbamoyladenosine tRNA methylthiotransferase MtaB